MSNKKRLLALKDTPLSWKEKDLLTAAEKYMESTIEFPLVDFAAPCFPVIGNKVTAKIAQVWRCSLTAYHLKKSVEKNASNDIVLGASRIYEQESQRLLGSIFLLENKFWKAFYTRQESELDKPLVAIDAMHYYTGCQEHIAYQLLIQSLKAMLKGHYENGTAKKEYFHRADRLLIDLPLPDWRNWLRSPEQLK